MAAAAGGNKARLSFIGGFIGFLGGKWNSMPLRYPCEQVRVRSVMLGDVRRHVFGAFRQWPGLDHRLDAVRRGRVTTIAVWAALAWGRRLENLLSVAA
jgi:hypothetical protein